MWALAGGVICFVLDARCLVSLMLDACFIVHGSWLKAHGSACGLAARLHRSESGPGAFPGLRAETALPGHEPCALSHKPWNIKLLDNFLNASPRILPGFSEDLQGVLADSSRRKVAFGDEVGIRSD